MVGEFVARSIPNLQFGSLNHKPLTDLNVSSASHCLRSRRGKAWAFLDRYPSNGLAGVTAVPVMTGGWPGHLLAVEVHLRPVLVELAATVPARGLYVTEPELADLDAAVAKWSPAAVPLIKTSIQK